MGRVQKIRVSGGSGSEKSGFGRVGLEKVGFRAGREKSGFGAGGFRGTRVGFRMKFCCKKSGPPNI